MRILLPLSALRAHDACDLERRIESFTAHRGFAPGEATTFREWIEVTPDVLDLIWATRCLEAPLGRRLAVVVAVKAAWRALPIFESRFPEDRRPRAALELVDRWLSGEAVTDEELRAAAYAASSAAYAAAYASADAADAAAYAAYASDAAYAASYAAYASAYASADAADAASAAERAQQRADFLAELDRLEA